MEGGAAKGPIECVRRDEEIQALKEIKAQKAHGHSGVTMELVAASLEVGIKVMAELCQGIPDGF